MRSGHLPIPKSFQNYVGVGFQSNQIGINCLTWHEEPLVRSTSPTLRTVSMSEDILAHRTASIIYLLMYFIKQTGRTLHFRTKRLKFIFKLLIKFTVLLFFFWTQVCIYYIILYKLQRGLRRQLINQILKDLFFSGKCVILQMGNHPG